jgi:hypothetical protein
MTAVEELHYLSSSTIGTKWSGRNEDEILMKKKVFSQ